VLERFFRVDPHQRRPERVRHGPELVSHGDGFRLHRDALSGFGKPPVGIQAPQVAVILAHLGDVHGQRSATPALWINPLPHHVAHDIQDGRFLHAHGILKVIRSGKAEELGTGDGLGEKP